MNGKNIKAEKTPGKKTTEKQLIGQNILPENRETDLSLYRPPSMKELGRDTPKSQFKRSGHLTDQILKYDYPRDGLQISLFDSLREIDQSKIIESGITREELVEGIQLRPSEQKIVDCLCKMLHDKSQTKDPKKQDFYTGNKGYELMEWGDRGEQTPAPRLSFTLYELTKEYKGGGGVSGKDVENVKDILQDLDSRKFLFKYKEIQPKKDGGRYETTVEGFKKLIEIVKISLTEYDKADIQISKQEETVILLNPIFRRQIDTKFILTPADIVQRTIIAYGSHNVSEITLRLRDYLMREHSSKRYDPEIGLERLYFLLAEKWMKESRKKKVKEYTEKAIETVKNLDLLLSYEIKDNKRGEPKIIFHLNKDWE